MTKLRAGWSLGMLAITRWGIFFFQFAIQNLWLKIYRPVILPVALFGCETWSLTWRKEHKLRVFENMVLRRIFGLEKDEVKGEWRKLHNEELNPLNPELNPICYLLALLGAHHFLHVSRIRFKSLTFRRLMSYTYGAPILDVSRSHTTTQHSR